jgi:hypothetical protein
MARQGFITLINIKYKFLERQATVDPNWFQCGSGSREANQCGSMLRVMIDLVGPLNYFRTFSYRGNSRRGKSTPWHIIDMVWLYRSPIPVGEGGIFLVQMISTCRRWLREGRGVITLWDPCGSGSGSWPDFRIFKKWNFYHEKNIQGTLGVKSLCRKTCISYFRHLELR